VSGACLSGTGRRPTAWLAVLSLLGWGLVVSAVGVATAPPAHAAVAARSTMPLLLVHGYTDSCKVFTSVDSVDPGPGAVTALDYFHAQGYTDVRTVGYYQGGGHTTSYHTHPPSYTDDAEIANHGDCFANVRDREQSAHGYGCQQAVTSLTGSEIATDGYLNSPIEYLGCLLAWYIHDVNTAEGTPVDVVAHSMGGLVIRSALAFSFVGNTFGYPTTPLKVRRVVTVGTPHLGITGTFAAAYRGTDKSVEVNEMTACAGLVASCQVEAINVVPPAAVTINTSKLLTALKNAGTPRGGSNAYWALMGSSVQCSAAANGLPSCANINELGALTRYTSGGTSYVLPDTDGAVNADSQMGMPADYKVMYGGFDTYPDPNNLTSFISVPAQGVVYSHEANSCLDLSTSDLSLTIDVPLIGQVTLITIPTEFCLTPPFYFNDGTSAGTLAHVCGSACGRGIDDLNVLYDAPQAVPGALAEIVSLLPPPPAPAGTVGHAKHAGNDYPWETIGLFDHQNEGTDPWAEYYGQCDSFAAWKVYENLYGTGAHPLPSIFPAPGWAPPYPGISNIDQNTWGNAGDWSRTAPQHGWAVDGTPRPGSIAVWNNGHIGPVGHVAYVTDVYTDGSITMENYNLLGNGQYSKFNLPRGGGSVTSFNRTITVPWPDGFAHIGDGPALDANGNPKPPDPKPSAPVWGYPGNVRVIGPGSASSQFSLVDVWYLRTAHGMLGSEEYTHTNGPTAVSTATWTPAGLAADTCYQVDTFVPDNYSDNATAVYRISDAASTSYAAANENAQTNDWSELGVFRTNGSGGISVRLDDRGDTGHYVAADAMRFWRQSDCTRQGNVSPIMMPTSYYPAGSWSPWSGHGFFGTEQYTTTTGTLYPGRTASWTPGRLLPNRCYDVSLYVPDNHSNNPAATYNTGDAVYGGNFWPLINENAFTNQFAGIGTFRTDGSGYLPVSLQNNGPSGDFVAADAAAFALNPICLPQNGGSSTFGTPMGSGVLGPGSPTTNFTTTGNWYSFLGFGLANHQLYAPDGTPGTARWTFNGTGGACYSLRAYVPIQGYANNTSAQYSVGTSLITGFPTVNQAVTNGWTSLTGYIRTGSDGVVTVTLTPAGNPGAFTAADAISFTRVTC
jgi:hypothetical protein